MVALLMVALAQAGRPDVDRAVSGVPLGAQDAAVVVGNEAYLHLPPAPFALRDADAVRDFLVVTRGVPQDRVQHLENATTATFGAALDKARAQVGQGGLLWVYFAGHGAMDVVDQDKVLLGADAPDRPKEAGQHGVALLDLVEPVAGKQARVIVLADVGFTGFGRDGARVFAQWRYEVPPDKAMLPSGTMIWTATSPGQQALSIDEVKHGAFTWWLLGALRGWADPAAARDADVTLAEASEYVRNTLVWESGGAQVPALQLGGAATGWILSSGVVEEAPDLGALRGPVEIGTPDDRELAQAREARVARTSAQLELGKKAKREVERIQTQATADWEATARAASAGGSAGIVALEAFIERYRGASVTVDDVAVPVVVPEVARAEEVLGRMRGGR